ncbi:MAG TPA: DNA repair protein RecO [Candidatus Saccharimonadales bacterium]
MNQIRTQGIVLSRTDYGETDRILTLLTPDRGKLRLMARGVRRAKSKLAGGIELFSTSDITYMQGRGEIGTLISARLVRYYDRIVKNIDRVQLGYELIKMLNRATEDQPEAEYFELLEQAFQALNEAAIDQDLILLWFKAHLLRQAGHSPNLHTDINDEKLLADVAYDFDFEVMAFSPRPDGHFDAGHIKTMRLLFSHHEPLALAQVDGLIALLPELAPTVQAMFSSYIRL